MNILIQRQHNALARRGIPHDSIPQGHIASQRIPFGQQIAGTPHNRSVITQLNPLQALRIYSGKAKDMGGHLKIGVETFTLLDKADTCQLQLLDTTNQLRGHTSLQPDKSPVTADFFEQLLPRLTNNLSQYRCRTMRIYDPSRLGIQRVHLQ